MNLLLSKTYNSSIDKISKKYCNYGSKILITGATGLIGSVLVDSLILANKNYGANYELTIVGRSLSKMKNRFNNSANINFIESSIDKFIIDDNAEYDLIIHLASLADPISYAKYPVETILTNVYGCKNLLEYCKNHTNTKFVYSSSFEVYGKSNSDVLDEKTIGELNFMELRSCYAESKRLCEVLINSYSSEYNVKYNILRYSSVYGPTMKLDDTKAHAEFIKNALNSKDIVMKSEGLQLRNYSYVFDVVDASLAVMFSNKTNEVYNIASSNSVSSIRNFAEIVSKICNVNVAFSEPTAIEKLGYSKPKNSVLNVNKLEQLGWKPNYTLDEGISDTIRILKEAI